MNVQESSRGGGVRETLALYSKLPKRELRQGVNLKPKRQTRETKLEQQQRVRKEGVRKSDRVGDRPVRGGEGARISSEQIIGKRKMQSSNERE